MAMIRLCEAQGLSPGEGRECTVAGQALMLIGTEQGIRAYRDVCPHQGRSMAFAPNEFLFTKTGLLVCPHHGATFEPDTGECTDGPCKGAALTSVPLVVEDGGVWVDPDGLD